MPTLNERRLHFAFENICTKEWIAGCNYLKNLFVALRVLDESPDIALLYLNPPGDDSYTALDPYLDRELTYASGKSRPLSQRIQSYLARKTHLPLGAKASVSAFLKSQSVNALFTSGGALKQTPRSIPFQVPTLVWLTDFQHLHLPEMFSKQEIDKRSRDYRMMAERAGRVVVSSQNALDDFKTFAPDLAHKARVLHFVAQPPTDVYASDPGWLCDYYHLPERFFFLPNQFWKHKNHQVVIESLALLKTRQPDIKVVCTGNTYDYRTPGYFPDLLASISHHGVRENLIILGTVPYAHLFQLIRQSLAVIQPSFFEGWSSTVEETKSIGKRMILSDIAVHREQAPHHARFFDPHDAGALASCLTDVFQEAGPGPDREMETRAIQELPERTRSFGQLFMDIAQEIIPGL